MTQGHKQGLCDRLKGGWDREREEEEVAGEKPQNSVKQLSLKNLRKKLWIR